MRKPLLFWVHVIFFHSLPSRVGCSFQGKLFSIFKLLCLVFARYYLSSRTALENCILFVIALRSSWENLFANTRFVLLTQAINQAQLVFSVDCTGELRTLAIMPKIPEISVGIQMERFVSVSSDRNISGSPLEVVFMGAFHYAKDSGNFGRDSNGKVRFGFFWPEYAGSSLEVVHKFGRNIPTEMRHSIFDKLVLCPN